jgi:hypothetical protein
VLTTVYEAERRKAKSVKKGSQKRMEERRRSYPS